MLVLLPLLILPSTPNALSSIEITILGFNDPIGQRCLGHGLVRCRACILLYLVRRAGTLHREGFKERL